MSRRPRRSPGLRADLPQEPPAEDECRALIDRTELALRTMGGRWHDHIPPEVRLELLGIAAPLIQFLIRAGLR